MKKFTNILIAIAAVSLAFASCSKLNDYPTFKAEDTFTYFVKASASVDEDAGKIQIPVSIAALDYQTVDVQFVAIDSTAAQGADYRIAGDGTLKFNGTTATQYIEIEIIPHTGVLTGDKTFTIELQETGAIKLGASRICTVTILDIDHPLAAILGTYSASGFSYFDGAVAKWTATFMKDPKDTHVVWIDGFIDQFAGDYPSRDTRIYGKVSEDLKTITFDLGQTLADKVDGNTLSLWSFNGSSVSESGTLTFNWNEGTKSFVIETGLGMGIGYLVGSQVSLYGLYSPSATSPVTFKKN